MSAMADDPVSAADPTTITTTLDNTHLLRHADGELVWTARDGADGGNTPSGRLRDDDVIFALRRPDGGHVVYSMATDAAPADAAQPFRLAALAAPALPATFLAAHLLPGAPAHLAGPAAAVTVVVSTWSGTRRAAAFHGAVLAPLLAAAGVAAAETVVTDSPRSIARLAACLPAAATDAAAATTTLVLLAGDGAVAELLAAAPAAALAAATVALLPLGTANALFHSLHRGAPAAGDPLARGLRTLFRGAPAGLRGLEARFSAGARAVAGDGARVRLLRGAVVASYGFHASLVWESDTEELRRRGAARFRIAAERLLAEGHGYRARVEVARPAAGGGGSGGGGGGGREALGRPRFGYVLAAAVSNLERTFTISPASRPLAGDLRLVHFGDVGGDRTMEIMMAAYDGGRHVGMRWAREDGSEDGVGYEEVEEVRVTVLEEEPRWRKVCVDGTIVELEQGGWMTVRKVPEPLFDVVVDRSFV